MMKTTGRINKQRVLILTQDEDGHAQPLIEELDALHCPWSRLDPGFFPVHMTLTASLHSSHEWSTVLQTSEKTGIHLEDIGSVWYRRPNSFTADPSLPPIEQEFVRQEAQYGLGGLLRSISGLWVNAPEANRRASYKPHQLQLARQCGFTIPKTLITNEPEAFVRFYEECHGRVVYKLLGPSLFWDGSLPISTYTNLVPKEMVAQASRIKGTAHLFQEYVNKHVELRVTVIGEEVFAAEIYSQHSEHTRIDWRKRYADLRYGIHHLPNSLQARVLALMRAFQLQFGAIDLIVTPEGEYVFLEINANGQFAWIEAATELPLFRTLARFLARQEGT